MPPGQVRMSRHSKTGLVRFVGTEQGRPIRHPMLQGAVGSAEAAARAYFAACGSFYGVQDEGAELQLASTPEVGAQRTVVRFRQTKSGIPIIAGELIVHLDNARNIVAVVAKTISIPAIDVRPTISPAAASQKATDVVAKTYGNSSGLLASIPQLWIYAPDLLGPGAGFSVLVWRIEVTSRDLRPVRELVLVDAQRGGVVLHFNQAETVRNRLTYTTNNSLSLPGVLVCDEANPCLSPPNESHAAAAHLNAADTYDFYITNLNRNSINDAGLTIVSTVHYDSNYPNAFWNGVQMVYGDAFGYPLADDVVGHELTHGVTQYTSNLFYYYQSGAINESFSDVFGEFIDLTNGHGNDAPGVRWLVGEDITGSGALRNMQNPPAFGDPDKMTSGLYFTGTTDNGGVHTNSGINNKAAVLMVDGGTFNGQSVTGIGIIKAAKIYYEAETHLLTSGADYADLYDALYQACGNLIGTASITANDCSQVRAATVAVEMNLEPVPGFNTEAPVCTAGFTVKDLFFDNLENGSDNFAFSALTGTVRWRYDSPYGPFAHSGSHFLFADDFPAAIADTSAAMTSNVTLPGNAFLHFAHAFGFEIPNYDGGVLEYSTDSGSTWTDAGPLFDVNGYTGTINSSYGNPLGGRSGFLADSHGYISSRLNLESLAGQNIRFRWRMGLDVDVYNWGWWVDDIRIYTCEKKRPGQITSD
jgi:Zn-dependent metalloprotease